MFQNEHKTKEQLIVELAELRKKVIELELALKDQTILSNVYGESSCTESRSSNKSSSYVIPDKVHGQKLNNKKIYSLSDLVDISLLQQLMNSIYSATGIMHAILDIDNNIMSSIGWMDICTKFHRSCPQTEHRCQQSDSYISSRLHEGPYIKYKCLNGLIDYATPIIIEGQHLATIFMGQILHEPPDEEYFRRQAQEHGFDETAYMEALSRVPIIPPDQVKYIMEFYSQLGRFLAAIGLERKRQLEAADQAIRYSEDKFRKAFHCSPDIITISTIKEGRYIEVNDGYLDILGYERHEVIGNTCADLEIWVVPSERDQMLKEIIERGSIHNLEVHFRTKNRKILTMLLSADIIDIEDAPHLLGVVKDITDRKIMEEALHQSEHEKLDILESITDGFYAIDFEWRFTFLNRAAEEMIGISREDLIGQKLEEGFPETTVTIYEKYSQVMKERIPQYYEFFSPVVKRWVEVSIYPARNGISVYFRDIEKRKEAEEKQKLNLERLEALLQLNQMSGATLQEISDFAYQEGIRLTGSEVGWIGFLNHDGNLIEIKSYSDQTHGAGFSNHLEFTINDGGLWAEAIRQCRPIIINDYTADHPYKKGIPAEHTPLTRFLIVPVISGDRIVALAGVANKPTDYDEADVYELKLLCSGMWEIIKQREEANKLLSSEERFHTAFHSSPMMMAMIRMKDDILIEANQRFLDVTEYNLQEALGHTLMELKLFSNQEHTKHFLNDLIERGRLENKEFNIYTRSGKVCTVMASIELVNVNDQICRLVVIQDITEQKGIQNELVKLDRLNLVGEMAASIGHEIRNPMTSVRGFLQMFGDKYSEDKEFLNLMIDELDRANAIITEFLSLAKNKLVELVPKNINALLINILPLIQANATIQDKSIKLEVEPVPDLLLDEKEIRQLILNLVYNGLESMAAGGNMIIRTYIKEENVVLAIQDQGHGIEPHILDKLGTPFFTTKENGTGLGLAVCYGIAKRHNARINIDTSSKGTTFCVYFPRPLFDELQDYGITSVL